jgi:hypothetical protein
VGRASCRAAMTGGCLSARRRAAFGRGRLQRDRTHDSVAHGPRNPHHLHTDLTTGYGCVVVDALPASEVGVAAIVRPALDDRPCAHALAVADIRRLPEPQLDLPATCVGEVRAAVGCASRSKRLDEPHALRKPSRHVICHDVRKRGCRDRAGTRKAKRTGTRGPERLRRWRKDPAGDWRRGVVRAGSTHDGHHKCQWNESSSKHRHVIMPPRVAMGWLTGGIRCAPRFRPACRAAKSPLCFGGRSQNRAGASAAILGLRPDLEDRVRIWFESESADVLDRRPTPGQVDLYIHSAQHSHSADEVTIRIGHGSFPQPSSVLLGEDALVRDLRATIHEIRWGEQRLPLGAYRLYDAEWLRRVWAMMPAITRRTPATRHGQGFRYWSHP